MKSHFALLVIFFTSALHPCVADEIGDRFCAQLRAELAPEHTGIYYRNSEGRIDRLRDGDSIKRRAEFDFFYFRNRSDSGQLRPGAIGVKIVYVADGSAILNHVSLFNNKQEVRERCKSGPIERYERFHGASGERNTCIRTTFHQASRGRAGLIDTLEPPERRRAFLFGVPGIDTRGFDAAVLETLPQIFQNAFGSENWKSKGDAPETPTPRNAYRSFIINYSGQAEGGSCIRFSPTIAPEYVAATFSITDLLEKEDGDFDRARARDIVFGDALPRKIGP